MDGTWLPFGQLLRVVAVVVGVSHVVPLIAFLPSMKIFTSSLPGARLRLIKSTLSARSSKRR